MAEDDRTRRWGKLERYDTASDTIQVLRVSIAEVRNAPRDPEARRRLRALAAEHGLWDQLAVLLGDAARAAGKLYRESGRLDRAAAIYELIVSRRPDDTEAWRALDDLLSELGRWHELAEVRGARAARAKSGVEKAALLRSQARALEQAGAQQ